MKKIGYIIVCLACMLFAGQACTGEIDDVFDKPPYERISELNAERIEILSAAENGWLIEYFATDRSEGYPILLKFDPSGRVDAMCRNRWSEDRTYVDSSFYSINEVHHGSVLSFATYNDVIHLFSDPSAVPGTVRGVGLGGDYEFVIHHADADSVYMQGKKRLTSVYMKKLPLDITWEAYYDRIYEINDFLFNETSPTLRLIAGEDRYLLTDGYSQVFTVTNEKDATESFELPFVLTETGFRFYKPIEIGGLSIKAFNLNEDKTALVSAENLEFRIEGVSLTYFFLNNNASWNFDPETMTPQLKENYNLMIQEVKAIVESMYPRMDITVAPFMKKYRNQMALYLEIIMRSGTNEQQMDGYIGLNPIITGDNSLSFSYGAEGSDNNGSRYYANSSSLKAFVDLISSEFQMNTENILNPIDLELVSKEDSNIYFTLSK